MVHILYGEEEGGDLIIMVTRVKTIINRVPQTAICCPLLKGHLSITAT